jgi:hypothetical protein
MADSKVITIPLCLSHAETTGFAAACEGKLEANVAWSGLLTLQGALAGVRLHGAAGRG